MNLNNYLLALALALVMIVLSLNSLIVQEPDEPEGNRFVRGNNTHLIVRTMHNKTYKFPLDTVNYWSAGSNFLNIETKEHDLWINIRDIEYYKLVNRK
jgi:hypothetical protein